MIKSSKQFAKWVAQFIEDSPRKENEKIELIRFWSEVYEALLDHSNKMEKERVQSKSVQYKNEVFEFLKDQQARGPLSEEKLTDIQMKIEDLTMSFDEENSFKTAHNLIKTLIRTNAPSAKDYLRNSKKNKLEKEDMELLLEFGQYTIEALIVHVLGDIFHSVENSLIIRVASLVEQLENSVRMQASLLKSRRYQKEFSKATYKEEISHENQKRSSKLEKKYPFGSRLVEFMEERELIILHSDLKGNVRVKTKKGKYYLPCHLYAVCNFDMSLLPIKLNLPMVCKPLDWTSNSKHKPKNMFDLKGGYLSGPTKAIYDRYRLLSSADVNNYYIDIGDNYQTLCNVMNKLQNQAFQINSQFLEFIQENEALLVEYGYLMPSFLVNLTINDVSLILRKFHMNDKVINKLCSFNYLLNTICKDIQRACYEKLILDLAIAYKGYHFYLPAFLDFRGRIYRCGVLHFHERDLARSLILFAGDDCKSQSESQDKENIIDATAFHYQSLDSLDKANKLLNELLLSINTYSDLLAQTLKAKRPFQFIANLIAINSNEMKVLSNIPITQDASASAYQIMSYLLLDKTMAKRTNLFPSFDNKIQDIYSYLLEELKEFMNAELDKNLSKVVSDNLTRKIVKAIFMPIIYGKTLNSTACDLKDLLSHYITPSECYKVASVCYKFWKTKYHGMECLIRLIRDIGWIASASDRPVIYEIPYFTTVQDYMIMDPINIWVIDRIHKNKRRVTLRVSSSNRDRRKTEISTFVNFIHQRDACIAMSVVEDMFSIEAPIYTVHDNFISTIKYRNNISSFYSNAICNMGPPLSIINEFIYMNVIQPIQNRKSYEVSEGMVMPKEMFSSMVIPKEILEYYLNANIPMNITNKIRATWVKRNLRILTSYENYTQNVCSDSQSKVCWKVHEEKWNDFQFFIKNHLGLPHFCVHY